MYSDTSTGEEERTHESNASIATFDSRGRIFVDGLEVLVGDEFFAESPGFSSRETVTDDLFTGNGVIVDSNIQISLELAGTTLDFQGQITESYRRVGDRSVEVIRQGSASASDGQDLLFYGTNCLGTLTR